MARTDNIENFLTDVAGAIREVSGTEETIPASTFDERIRTLPSIDPDDYYTKTESDEKFVQKNGDTMTGTLDFAQDSTSTINVTPAGSVSWNPNTANEISLNGMNGCLVLSAQGGASGKIISPGQKAGLIIGSSSAGENNSVAIGKKNKACNINATAIGENSVALGYCSFSNGLDTIAGGLFSTAFGNRGVAAGQCSFVEGGGDSATLLGTVTLSSITVNTNPAGMKTTSITFESNGFTVQQYDLLDEKYPLETVSLSNTTYTTTINGDVSMFLQEGHTVNITRSKHYAAVAFSHAEGYNTKALSYTSHAEGSGTTASGVMSHTEGYDTRASGNQSHAEGQNTIASSNSSHAEGYYTTASGSMSHAEGNSTTASGGMSHAEGLSTTASGDPASHAEGYYTTASSSGAHAEGYQTTASGTYSHAEGYLTEVAAHASHGEGTNGYIDGAYNHGEGNSPYIAYSSSFSHVEGSCFGMSNNNTRNRNHYCYPY